MKLKLFIDGESKSIIITPENSSDKKLLGFIVEHDRAEIEEKRGLYNREIEKVKLNLFTQTPVFKEIKEQD